MTVPTFDALFNPLIQAMKNLGGSARNEEIVDEVAKVLKMSDEDYNRIHRKNTTQLEYRLGWTKNYLKHFGILQNSAKGVWFLTPKGQETTSVDPTNVVKTVKEAQAAHIIPQEKEIDIQEISTKSWEDKLLTILRGMNPYAFERLSQRLLKEAGFENVIVTKKSGDGGIDGKGTLKIGGLISFNVYFQSKRYEGTVPSSVVRDFRGAIVGRADKGIIITTGVFSKEAKDEARRDGALMIDLIDGRELANQLRDLKLGVHEEPQIDEEFFKTFEPTK